METKKSFADAIVSQELNKEAWKKLSTNKTARNIKSAEYQL